MHFKYHESDFQSEEHFMIRSVRLVGENNILLCQIFHTIIEFIHPKNYFRKNTAHEITKTVMKIKTFSRGNFHNLGPTRIKSESNNVQY